MNYGTPAKALKVQIRMLSKLFFLNVTERRASSDQWRKYSAVLEEEHGLSWSTVGEKATF